MLELSWNATKQIDVGSEKRSFIEDGDSIVIKGFCEKNGIRIGFGECRGKIIA